MERDGWPDLPVLCWPAPMSLKALFQFLLFLLRWHNSMLTITWVKGHSSNVGNEAANALARQGVDSDLYTFDVSSLSVPPGWVDLAPVLNHQSLAHLTYLIVQDGTLPPILTDKFWPFMEEWTAWMKTNFLVNLDILQHFSRLWSLEVPPGLKELLWKEASSSLPWVAIVWCPRIRMGMLLWLPDVTTSHVGGVHLLQPMLPHCSAGRQAACPVPGLPENYQLQRMADTLLVPLAGSGGLGEEKQHW